MTANGDFYDKLEIRDPEQREREQFGDLRELIALAKRTAPYWQRVLADIESRRHRLPRRTCFLACHPQVRPDGSAGGGNRPSAA